MKVLGVITEYNPFHNGHMYHIEQSKAITGCDAVVCVMSGNFIQRGEPALLNKFARAEIAIKSGINLVIELPLPFAMSSAEAFGFGAVKILDSIGVVDCISFGSESNDMESLQLLSSILVNEPSEYRSELKRQLSLGLSFPVCRQNAIKKYLDTTSISASNAISSLLETSNNILGIEYLKALIKMKSSIKPYTIKRISNQYNTGELTGSISSATAIRNTINTVNNNGVLTSELMQTLPPFALEVIETELNAGRAPVNVNSFNDIILALLRKASIEEINELPGVSEGLEYRIKRAGENSGSFDELMSAICTKRYTQTRIRRILFSLLAGVTKNDFELFMQYGGPQYARVLGFDKIGMELMSKMKQHSLIPIITKPTNYKNSCNKLLVRMLDIEAKSTDIYVLGYKNPVFKKSGQEYTKNIIINKM